MIAFDSKESSTFRWVKYTSSAILKYLCIFDILWLRRYFSK